MHLTTLADTHASIMHNIPFLAGVLLMVPETHINGPAMIM